MGNEKVSHDAEALRQSVSRFVRAMRSDSRTAQDDVLDLLDKRGPLNVASMAEARGTSHQTMRVVVAKLEATGLVAIAPDKADRRSRLASITSDGRDLLSRARMARTNRIAGSIDQLPASQQNRIAELVKLLDRLVELAG